ncbi:bifunctional aspartate kinase/homoserine dehydrogenase I, partial [Enterobacter hormaechei]|nr:bifunctional aspartate kinase/homoserine dehydrogenase I [Enterobacter hormaechei]
FNVVTPNKKANTSSMAYYHQIRKAAEKSKRKFLYDTNVGAGLPVIENLQNLLNAGDELVQFNGILSGSLSFIFGMLDEGMSLSQATLLAKEKGYTEPDPR